MFNMKLRKFKWGLFLIAAGSVALAHNYGLLSFSFRFFRDWPVVLVAFGLLGVWKSVSLKYNSEKRLSGVNKRIVVDVLKDVENGSKSVEDAIRELNNRKEG